MSVEPYTHQAHAKRCTEAGLQGRMLSSQLVQVKKRGVTYCARIANAWTVPNGPDCWTVESFVPELARFTVPVRQVVLCGQPDCLCLENAAMAGERSEHGGAAFSGVSK